MADLSLIANSARFFLIQDSDLSTYICTSYIYICIYIYIFIHDIKSLICDISFLTYPI